MRKNTKATLVNLTLNMRYKMTDNIKFVITRLVFSSSKCTKICFRPGLRLRTPLGELTTLPQTPSRLGRGIPPPPSPRRSTPSASWTQRLWRLGSHAPSTENPGYAIAVSETQWRQWLRACVHRDDILSTCYESVSQILGLKELMCK